MVDKGQNQTVVRDNNMKLILFSLLENSMSCSDLAEKLLLSKPAMTKITSEMLELGLIVSNGSKDRRQKGQERARQRRQHADEQTERMDADLNSRQARPRSPYNSSTAYRFHRKSRARDASRPYRRGAHYF